MDPLTHTLTGLALSRAGLKRLSIYATPILLLAVNAPDIDIVTFPAGAATYLHYHRYITHAFLAIPFLALLPVLVVRLFARKPFDWKWAYAVSVLGVASHPLLDWMNAYGIRFLLPFSSKWYRLEIVTLGDLWIWAVLLLAALAPALARLVNTEIGAKPGSGRGFAIAALCFMLVYPFCRYLLHERAVAVLDSRMYEGHAPARIAALPGSANPFHWTGLVDTGEFYSILDVNLMGEFDPSAGRILYKPQPGPREASAAAAARQTEAFRVFLDFSQYPYWQFTPVESPEDGIRVDVMDLRFGAPPHPRFVATAIVDRTGRVIESGFRY
jgi:inner membrane protein